MNFYGHTHDIFDKWGRGSVNRKYGNKNFIKDRFMNVYYYIETRNKNTGKWRDTDNAETLKLFFDPNLSTDFIHTELNIITGESMTISMIESSQRHIGDTSLSFTIQYVDNEQNIYETTGGCTCTTLAGTVSKRLKHYKEAFLKAVELYVSDYHANGVKTHYYEKVKAIAAYIHLIDMEMQPNHKLGHSIKSSINTILVLYSIFNNDCYKKQLDRVGGFELGRSPYYNPQNFENLHKVALLPEDEKLIGSLMQFYINNKQFVLDIFKQCAIENWSGDKHDYNKLSAQVKSKLSILEE